MPRIQDIDKVLDLASDSDEREYNNAQSNKKYWMAVFMILIGLFVFLTYYLTESYIDTYKELLKIVMIFAGGMGGGYGLNSYIKNR